MRVNLTNAQSSTRSKERSDEYILVSGRQGTVEVESQTARNISKRVYRTGSSKPGGYPRGTSKIGGNIDQLIRTIQNQIAVNQSAIEGIYEMQSQLKACLDELIEIRDTSKNVD